MGSSEVGFLAVFSGIFGVLAVFLGPIVYMAMRNERHKRELAHAERMRALELGQGLPDDEVTARIKALTGNGLDKDGGPDGGGPAWDIIRRCYWMGFALPVGAFLGTTYLGPHGANNTAVWVATAFIGTASILSGTILAFRMTFISNPGEPGSLPTGGRFGKSMMDPDAFDITARRG